MAAEAPLRKEASREIEAKRVADDAELVQEDEASREKETAGSGTSAADHKETEENSNADSSTVAEKVEGQGSKVPEPEVLGQKKKDDEGSAVEEAQRGDEDGASARKPAEESTMAAKSLAEAVEKPLLDSGLEVVRNPKEQGIDRSVTDHGIMEESEGRNETPKVSEAVDAPTDGSLCTVEAKDPELEETRDSESLALGKQKEEEAVDQEPEEVGCDLRAPDPGPETEKTLAEAVGSAVIKSEEREADRTIEEPEGRNETHKVNEDGSCPVVEVKEPEMGKTKDSETQALEEDLSSTTKSTEFSEEEEREKEKEKGSETNGELPKETKIQEEKSERTTEERDEGAVKKDEKARNLAELFKQEGGPEVQQVEAPNRPSRSLMAKVKHSMEKVKKVIVGKSPPSRTIPGESGDGSGGK